MWKSKLRKKVKRSQKRKMNTWERSLKYSQKADPASIFFSHSQISIVKFSDSENTSSVSHLLEPWWLSHYVYHLFCFSSPSPSVLFLLHPHHISCPTSCLSPLPTHHSDDSHFGPSQSAEGNNPIAFLTAQAAHSDISDNIPLALPNKMSPRT